MRRRRPPATPRRQGKRKDSAGILNSQRAEFPSVNQDASEIPTSELERRMRPGSFSQDGFLGPEENLGQVLLHDEATIKRLGISYDSLAGRLEELILAGERSPGHRVVVNGEFEVTVFIYKGFQICPWARDPDHSQCDAGEGATHASVEWRIRNLGNGLVMRGGGLAVHLIRDHHFFEGLESPHRIEPELLKVLFNL